MSHPDTPLTVSDVLNTLSDRQRRAMESEILLMSQTHPQDPPPAVMQSTGNIYWIHRTTPFSSSDGRTWTFMIICNGFSPVDQPSFSLLPMQPDYAQIQREADAAGLDISSRIFPRPEFGTVCLDGKTRSTVPRLCGDHHNAAAYGWDAHSWAWYFESGLKDPQVWIRYCRE